MAELSETVARLRVIGDDLDPDEVTRLLGKTPDLARRKGEVTGPADASASARTGAWLVNTDSSAPGDLDRQVGQLLAGTTDDLAVWWRVADRYRRRLLRPLHERGERRNDDIATNAAEIGERGIELALDLYAASREIED